MINKELFVTLFTVGCLNTIIIPDTNKLLKNPLDLVDGVLVVGFTWLVSLVYLTSLTGGQSHQQSYIEYPLLV